jgi:hypothetical protein
MGIVIIKCPATGVAISTGIIADRSSFASSPVFYSRTRCPICRSDHEWSAGDAWLRNRWLRNRWLRNDENRQGHRTTIQLTAR